MTDGGSKWWARKVSNLRPLQCQCSALPLSYAPAPVGTVYTIHFRTLPSARKRCVKGLPVVEIVEADAEDAVVFR